MKVAVIGAMGRTGQLVVNALLIRGHTVNGIALVVPETKSYGITWYRGDATNKNDLEKTIKDCDAIISVLGHTWKIHSNIQTIAMKHLVSIAGNKTIVSLTGTGVRIKGDKPSLIDSILNLAIRIADPKRVQDGIEHAKVLEKSNCNWVILRVLKLANGNKAQSSKLTEGGPALMLVNRVTVANYLCDLAENNNWNHKMPVISRK